MDPGTLQVLKQLSCPEELFPKEACDDAKAELRRAWIKWTGPTTVKVHPMHEGRRVPIKSLVRKLSLEAYDVPAPVRDIAIRPRRLIVPLKQGAGVPNRPVVKAGERVTAGQPLGEVPPKALGATVHASLDATVVEVSEQHIILERSV